MRAVLAVRVRVRRHSKDIPLANLKCAHGDATCKIISLGLIA